MLDTILEILKYTLPTLIALFAVYWTIDRFLKNEDNRRYYEIQKSVTNLITPVKLSAYERLILFLERATPDSLVLRVQQPEMTNLDLQAALLTAIRQEYEHNFSQQLYVSDQAAEMVKNAKESLVQLVNMASANVSSSETSTQLAIMLIETYNSMEETPVKVAIHFLKSEVRSYFG